MVSWASFSSAARCSSIILRSEVWASFSSPSSASAAP